MLKDVLDSIEKTFSNEIGGVEFLGKYFPRINRKVVRNYQTINFYIR